MASTTSRTRVGTPIKRSRTEVADHENKSSAVVVGFLTYAAYDFASDARGYSYGGVAEFYWDNWTARFGRITPPKDPNLLPIDFRIFKYYGDQIEL
jgi:high affinity Mn2+ porin